MSLQAARDLLRRDIETVIAEALGTAGPPIVTLVRVQDEGLADLGMARRAAVVEGL